MRIEHNSGKLFYRNPFGACPTDTQITLRLCVESFSVPERVCCIIDNVETEMEYAFETNGNRIYEGMIETPSEGGLLFYYFFVCVDGCTLYYGNNSAHTGGLGEEYSSVPESKYQITVYNKDFKTPDWMKNAVVYQIFPDRFMRGKETPFHGIERKWNEEPFYRPDQFGGDYLSNDFFGGNFDGIKKKLPYLKDLGITAIYLNPISKAFSNHRYDTGDYETPDELLGSVKDFEELSKEAEREGIRIILDGVFSHTGADSRYFNKYGNYNSIGAYQSKESPFYSWYTFASYPDKYESWWGFDTLPNVNELDKNFTEYIAEGKNSVIKKWLRRGASGFRLDVADELPDEFIKILRKSLKEENPDSLLIGEVWEDASNKVSYGEQRNFLMGDELDSVMNYVFRDAVLSYLTTGEANVFSGRLHSLLENYPKEALYTAMNLLSTHDVPRALTVLADTPDFRTLSRQEQHDYVISEDKLDLAKRRMVLAICLQMTLPGAPTVYYGDEMEMTGFADPFNRAPMDWEHGESEIMRQLKLFTKLRNATPSLRTGFCTTIFAEGGVFAFMRNLENGKDAFGKKQSKDEIIIIVNASRDSQYINLNLSPWGIASLSDTLSGEKIADGYNLSMEILPLSYRIFTPERKQGKCTKIQNI
ncbi:MAG: glycoside hydrolase family 13 protein [Clostridia bacterium]|nr:glycoside hydrolase family 13 protein [Clostridia bacterium]